MSATCLGILPDEVLTQIVSYLPTLRDLCATCLISRRFYAIADPVLYKSIRFDQPKHHLTFSESLIARPRRGSLIQNVRLEYPGSELLEIMCLKDSSSRIDNFSHAISSMSNLETLVVSVPETLCRGIGTLFNGPFDLACLKTCSLFYQCENDGYWDLQENIHIFSHPTLETLTIRKAKLDERGFDSLESPSETPLMELNLIECDINDDGLAEILVFPEALKSITITQLEVPNPPLQESPAFVDDYITSLDSAQHSLEKISIDFATLGGKKPLRLRGFDALEILELRDYQLFGTTPRLHSVGLPPDLERLKFFNRLGEDEELTELLCYAIENQDMLARKPCQLVVAAGAHDLPAKLVETCRKSLRFQLGVEVEDDDDDDEEDESSVGESEDELKKDNDNEDDTDTETETETKDE